MNITLLEELYEHMVRCAEITRGEGPFPAWAEALAQAIVYFKSLECR